MAASSRPSAFLDFEIVGSRRGVQQMLDHLNSALSPVGLSLFMKGSLDPWIKRRAAARFRSEGDDASGKWAPLQEATISIRENMGFGPHPINRRTGQLERYITQSSSAITAAPGLTSYRYPGEPPATKGLREKVRTAQVGKASPSTKPRPVLAMDETDLAYVVTALAFHVKGYRS